MEEAKLMQQITRNMAKAFSQISKLCLDKLKQIETRDWSEYNNDAQKNQNLKKYGSTDAKNSTNGITQVNGNHSGSFNGVIEKERQRQDYREFNLQRQKARKNKPKSPVSSFVIFCRDHRQQILKDQPNCTAVEVTKIASKCWNQLSQQQKDPYLKKYHVQKIVYDEELAKYYKQFPEEAIKNKKEKKQSKKAIKKSEIGKRQVQKGSANIQQNDGDNEYSEC